ncbi:energy transducer TonB [Pandoraea horticolens]|uniref:Protein TonB n=1 Tax=Pandoraea horticolens TaxID=2508298 RepID=A0A5E4VSQ9_9BURK|nr:TonB family protein [Pandoraea horticolens]VVE14294.1 energy transducer TonB [Pandoraea horticolens]
MKYVVRQQRSASRYVGIGFVALLHAAVVYMLLNGLASKVVDVIRQPIETRVIEEVQPPPPPPPAIPLPPPPKLAAPPPPFIPPPEVSVQTPPVVQNTITAQSATAEPSTRAAPSAPVAPASAAPQSANVGVVCPNSTQVRASIKYPREALRNNVTGEVVVTFTVDVDGAVKDLQVTKSAAPSLERAAENAVKQFNCVAQGREMRVQVPFSFKLD